MDELDIDFYKNFYHDLKNFKDKELKEHWENHGKFENRIPNKNILKKKRNININENINKINNYFNNDNNYFFSIIIRTHRRELNFYKCLNSILIQKYKNYEIIIGYDDIYTYKYLLKINSSNIKIVRTYKNSNDNAFFDEYFNQLYNYVSDNSYIIMLDDDNYFISDNCLNYLNNNIKTKINLFKFLRNDKEIYPSDLNDFKYGELDTACICFHSSLKDIVKWKTIYGSDYYFITELIKKSDEFIYFIPICFISTQLESKPYNLDLYNDKMEIYKNTRVQLNRIDYKDYLEHYKDLKKELNSNELLARKHYMKVGYKESRVFKFKDFNYDLFEYEFISNLKYGFLENKITLITSLFNETNEMRINEFILTLKFNLNNYNIKKIIIFYDTSKGYNKQLFDIFKHNKIKIIEINNRPNFKQMSDVIPLNEIGIICNADIIYDESLEELFNYNLNDNIVGLTRWDFISEKSAIPRLQNEQIMTKSVDSWIILNNYKINKQFEEIHLGTWECDGNFIKLCEENKINYISECLNIKSYHIHFCNNRNYVDK